jgi:hypothetical protein
MRRRPLSGYRPSIRHCGELGLAIFSPKKRTLTSSRRWVATGRVLSIETEGGRAADAVRMRRCAATNSHKPLQKRDLPNVSLAAVNRRWRELRVAPLASEPPGPMILHLRSPEPSVLIGGYTPLQLISGNMTTQADNREGAQALLQLLEAVHPFTVATPGSANETSSRAPVYLHARTAPVAATMRGEGVSRNS